MPLILSPEVLAAMEAGTIAHAWLIELFCDEGTLRGWDKPFSMTYLGNTYEPLSDSWQIEGEIRLGSDLVPEPLTFTFDGSLADINTSFVGRLVDRAWHQRPCRLTGLLLEPGSGFLTPLGAHLVWNGTMDVIETAEGEGEFSKLVLGCEGGIFRALDRNLTTCTDYDQKRRNPNDRLFENVAIKPRQDVPFGKSWGKVPGGGERGGGSSGGGGVTGSFRGVSR